MTFFDVLEASASATGGSAISRALTPPLREDEDWMPSNLNIYIPLRGMHASEVFFADIRLELSSQQPGIARPYKFVTNGFVQYESRLPGHPIMLSESIDACIITPAVAASTTLTMWIATCSTSVVMYPELVTGRRAHSGWYSPTVESCIKLQDRGFRHSVSTKCAGIDLWAAIYLQYTCLPYLEFGFPGCTEALGVF
ncbi:hypothetical protein B0H13DRAFT_1862053 [Mycena leptocephala]|nr:hypothetical protein B0H13DRAFT_1862053 [Mycena leptocephala]